MEFKSVIPPRAGHYLTLVQYSDRGYCCLQGGHFDLADRMFNSVREAWLSASRHNMADVKELIPEFFYLPEFVCNSNNFDLGRFYQNSLLSYLYN